VEHTRSAGGTFFRPDASFLKDTYESRIKARVNGLIAETLRNSLNASTAAKRKNRVISLYRVGCLLDKDVVALALYGQFLDFKGQSLQFRRHSQCRSDDAYLSLSARKAYGNTGAAAQHEKLFVIFYYFHQVGNIFSLSYYHLRLSF
jgi:hypothetical protein